MARRPIAEEVGGVCERPAGGWVRGDAEMAPTADALRGVERDRGRAAARAPGASASATEFFCADFVMPPDAVVSAPRASRITGREKISERIVAALRQASGIASMRCRPVQQAKRGGSHALT